MALLLKTHSHKPIGLFFAFICKMATICHAISTITYFSYLSWFSYFIFQCFFCSVFVIYTVLFYFAGTLKKRFLSNWCTNYHWWFVLALTSFRNLISIKYLAKQPTTAQLLPFPIYLWPDYQLGICYGFKQENLKDFIFSPDKK